MLFAEYVSTGAFVGIFYEGAILTVFIILLIYLFRIYKTTKLKMTLKICLGFFFYMLACFFSWLSKFYLWHNSETILAGPYFLQLLYTFKITMACIVTGNYFILSFFWSFFGKEISKKHNMIIIIIKMLEVIIILTIHIPAYSANSSEIAQTTNAIGFFIMFLDMLYTIPYGIKAYKASKEKEFGKKYLNFSIMAFSLLGMCLLFFLDRVTMILEIPGPFGELGYTGFYFAAWLSTISGLYQTIKGSVLK